VAGSDPPVVLPPADRMRLLWSTLTPFPGPAGEPHRDCFAGLLDTHGVGTVFGYLRRRRILPTALASHGWHPAMRDEAGPFWLFRQASLVIREVHRAELARLAGAFAERDLPLLAFKGLALDLLLGNTAAPSFSGDIDVLVRRAGLPAARATMEALGYETNLRIETGRVRRTPARVARMTEEAIYSFGQCQPYDRLVPAPELQALAGPVLALMPTHFCVLAGRLHFKISVDLHYTLNLLADDLGTRVKPAEDVWWADTQPLPVDGAPLATFSDRVQSWALLHRLYVDSTVLRETTIKPLCHLKLLRRAGRLDVPHVHEVARRYPYLRPSLHYALRAANLLCPLGIDDLELPADLWTASTPTMNAGDCLPALLDFGYAFELGDFAAGGVPDGRVGVRVY
jgi:hypothetical protein